MTVLQTIGNVNRYLCFGILAFNLYITTKIKIHSTMNTALGAGGPWKYLTIWNLVLQTLFWALLIASEFFKKKKSKKPGFLDIMFYSVVLPLSMIVASFFWGIYFFDRNLILPDSVRPHFPEWHNQSIHTLVLIGPLIELLCIEHKAPTRKQGLAALYSILIAYTVNLHYFGLVYGNWIYPFLNKLSYPFILLFVAFGGIISLFFFFLSEKLQHRPKGKHH